MKLEEIIINHNKENTSIEDPSQLIISVYRALLDREPDTDGINSWIKWWKVGNQSIESLLKAIVQSEEFQQKSRKSFFGSNPTLPFIFDNSQFGEIGLLIEEIVSNSCPHKTVVDIGARGKDRSNSYDLITGWGWKGLLIEANPDLIPNLEKLYENSNGTVIHSAISDFEGEIDLYIGSNLDVSSITKAYTTNWCVVEKSVRVKCHRIAPILIEHKIPFDFELLSIDIEGEDIKVMNDLVETSRYRPRYIIIEASFDFSTKKLEDLPFGETLKSSYRICGQTKANLILKANGLKLQKNKSEHK